MTAAETKNLALYRKYRPSDFENLVGQYHIQTTLLNALKLGQVAHAYLFSGPRGTGKTTTARLIAKGLNCEKLTKKGEPCNACDMCTRANNGQLIDIIEIDAASNRGIDEIRDLREKIKFSPVHGKKKIFIIDEVHMLTKEAFNALLKTLEEPPEHAHLILATTEAYKVPSTIVSRCQHFDFRRITVTDIESKLAYIAEQEGISCDKEALAIISEASDGSLRDAIGLLEQMTFNKEVKADIVTKNLGLVDFQIVNTFLEIIYNKKVDEGITFINDIYTKGVDFKQLIKSTIEALRKKLIKDVDTNNTPEILHIVNIIKALDNADKQLKTSAIHLLPLELLLIELKLQDEDCPPTNNTSSSPKQAKPEKKELTKNNGEITLDSARSVWGKIIDNIVEPHIRMALRKATLTGFDSGELIIVMNSKFEYEKLNTIKTRNAIQASLKEILGQNITIKLEYDTTPLVQDEIVIEDLTKKPNDFSSIMSDLGATIINE